LVEVIRIEGWDPNSFADTNGYAWVMPSPNMPTVDTAVVYPGGCLIEGTNLSEGRGTTRPFEMIGAPWLHGERLASSLSKSDLRGVKFRPIQFEPTFNKYQGQLCSGVFVHVTDRQVFEPILTYSAIMLESIRQTGIKESKHVQADRFIAASPEMLLPGFAWKQPPYEYEFKKMPIDILFGNIDDRRLIEDGIILDLLRNRWEKATTTFNYSIEKCRLYDK
jgi:uncharacterized protein YbbC (DUF1343 family)